MKKIVIFLTFTFTLTLAAQEYGFGIVSDYNSTGNNYEFTFLSTPDFTNVDTDLNFSDIQITLAVTAGLTIESNSLTEILGSGWQLNTAITGATLQGAPFNIGDGSKDLWIFTLPVSTTALTTLHTSGEGIPFFSFIVDNTPTSGSIEILENADPIAIQAASVGFVVDNLINVNLNDGNGVKDYFGGFTNGASSFDFFVLNTADYGSLSEISIYPNPVSDILNINGDTTSFDKIDLFSITGQQVKRIESDFDKIDVKGIDAGVYFLKISKNKAQRIIKFIKE